MSTIQYVTVKPEKAIFTQTCHIDMDTSSDQSNMVPSVVNMITTVVFTSVNNAISMLKPVQVKNDVIKVNENLMDENIPYAFVYQGKDYMVSKTSGTTQLFELRD